MKVWIEAIVQDDDYASIPVGFIVYLQKGRRKMAFDFEFGDIRLEDLAETLSDILSELGVVPKAVPIEASDEFQAFRAYQASIEQAVASGAQVIDPRVRVASAPEQKEADVLNSPTHGPYIKAALAGPGMLKDENHAGWENLKLVDADDGGAKAAASAHAASGGVNAEGASVPGTKYSERFGPKPSDHVKSSPS